MPMVATVGLTDESAATPSVTATPAESADFFLALVLSLLAIVLFLFAALVIVCCLYRRSNRRRRRRDAAAADADPYLHDALVTKKHVPVIFAEELDDNRQWPPAGSSAGLGDSGGPLVLPDEKPPVRMPDDVELDGSGGGAANLPDLPAGFERLRYGNKPAPPPP